MGYFTARGAPSTHHCDNFDPDTMCSCVSGVKKGCEGFAGSNAPAWYTPSMCARSFVCVAGEAKKAFKVGEEPKTCPEFEALCDDPGIQAIRGQLWDRSFASPDKTC